MPTKTELAKFAIRGSVTESAPNTYTEAAIQTNLAATGDMMFIATGLWLTLDPNGPQAAVDSMWCHLAYSTQTNSLTPSSADFIWGATFHGRRSGDLRAHEVHPRRLLPARNADDLSRASGRLDGASDLGLFQIGRVHAKSLYD